MAKNDYFVVAYRILMYLYSCFKEGEKPDTSIFGVDALNINNGYWVNIMESLWDEGYIKGLMIINSSGVQGVKLIDLKITQKGIEYLTENSTMQKAKDFLKTVKEIVPGF